QVIIVFAILPTLVRADSCPVVSRDSIIKYAQSGVGSPYVWGGDKWNPNNKGWGGADCSGYVLKAWQIPYKAGYTQSVGHPYSTFNFYFKKTHWYPINRNNLAKGDILVYRNKGRGHVAIYHYGDKWGSPVVYEARSRKHGIVHGARYFPSYYKGRRRHRLVNSDPKLMATVKISSNSYLKALPEGYASTKLYVDFLSKKDPLFVRNSDYSSNTMVGATLFNYHLRRGVLGQQKVGVAAYQQSGLAQIWRGNGFIRLLTHGQKMYAWRQNAGFKYLAKNISQSARTNYINYFEPKRDLLYLTNPRFKAVKAVVYLVNNNKVYHRKTVRIARRSVAMVSYKRSKQRRLKGVYVRINASGGRIFVSKKTKSSFYTPAQTANKINKTLYIQNFDPARNLLYITNPNRRKARLILKYIQDGRSRYQKRIHIRPHDVVLVDKRRRLKRLGETFIKIIANVSVVASNRMARATYQLAEPLSFANKTTYVADFNAASETLYILNPIGSVQKATVNIFTGNTLVYSNVFSIGKYRQLPIDLRSSAAARYSNTYVQIISEIS
ncbi:MAG: peptidoglycan endopeptidase, partial [Actinobacteria bacterium]